MTLFENVLQQVKQYNMAQDNWNKKLAQVEASQMYSGAYYSNFKDEMRKALNVRFLNATLDVRDTIKKELERAGELDKKERKVLEPLEVQNELTMLAIAKDTLDVNELNRLYSEHYKHDVLRRTLQGIAESRDIVLVKPKTMEDELIEGFTTERSAYFAGMKSDVINEYFTGFQILTSFELYIKQIEEQAQEA